MRHFSGEFEGIRLLMLDELDAISGGDGDDTDDTGQPQPDPLDPGPDIVVTAPRDYTGGFFWGGGAWHFTYSDGSIGTDAGSVPHSSHSTDANNFADQAVTDNGHTGADPDDLLRVKQGLKNQIALAYDTIHALSDSQRYTINTKTGESMTGSQIKSLFDGQSWNIGNDPNLKAGYAGHNVYNAQTNTYQVNINYSDLKGYMAGGQEGINFLIFHEMGHVTPGGLQDHNTQYQAFLHRSGHDSSFDDNDPEFRAQEQHANDAARDLMLAANYGATTYQPTFGY